MTKKILILMSDTGGGHRSSAAALKAGFARHAGESVHVDVIDLLRDHWPPPFRYLPATYTFWVNHTPRIWHLIWRGVENERVAHMLIHRVAPVIAARMTRVLDEFQPDLLISVHPLAQHVTVQSLAQRHAATPFATVVTDLVSVHRAWFHPAVTRCFVATGQAQARALAWGLQPAQVRVTGVPLRGEFVAAAPVASAQRRELGLDPRLPLALVLGGGDGVGNVATITRHLAQALGKNSQTPRGQVAVICGRNRALQQKLARQSWPAPVHVQGYVDNMHAWMHAADCVVTKAGPGTIAEALACGRPLVLTDFIPGQEEGNVAHVVENGAGAYCAQPAAAAQTVTTWFAPGNRALDALATCARRLARPHATDEIVCELLGLI